MAHHFPPPTAWQAFEGLCCDLFRELWNAPMTQKNGRSGQPQAGVDVFGLPSGSASWFGVQCKQKLGSPVTLEELEAEIEKAKGFNPTLSHYIFATTAPRDQQAQKWARELTESSPFEVTVFAWDDICDALADVKYRDLLAKHFPSLTLVQPTVDITSPEEALHAFRCQHWSELLPLPSLAQARGQRHADLLLTDIYTALDITATLEVSVTLAHGTPAQQGSKTFESKSVGLPGERTYLKALIASEHSMLATGEALKKRHGGTDHRSRRIRALEATAANRRLVLVGAPGSGKSTFGRFLTLCLLGESLGRAAANLSTLVGDRGGDSEPEVEEKEGFVPWPHGALLPFFVSLQKFQTSGHFPPAGEGGKARHLFAFLESLGEGAFFDRGLAQALRRDDGALVILDGLDETPSAETGRVQLRQVISGFVRAYPGCRVVVTSRPYAYRIDSPWRLDDAGFASVDLAPFDRGQQQAFVTAWYRRLVARKLLDVKEEREEEMVADLLAQIERTSYLEPLARSPLMLTMMADLHASNGGRLPGGGRAALYRESVALLLDRWNETREGTKPTEALGMPLEQIEEALQKLAFEVHRSRGASDAETPEIGRAELWDALVSTRDAHGQGGAVDDREIMAYLHQRSGILLGESETVYRFPHRSYQEYLAAAHLVDNEFPDLLDKVVSEDPALWREVVQLAVGQVKPFMAWTIIETLVPTGPPAEGPALDDPRFVCALLAALSIREQKLGVKRSGVNEDKCERVRLWLRRAVEQGAMDVQDRAQAGQVLGLLGDDRPGVGLVDGSPDIEWVEIPAGTFIMGGEMDDDEKPVHDEQVEGFRISRYPLTHAQYQGFVDDGGYGERWRRCWTEAGWEWKGERQGPATFGEPFELANHPQVGVSWYEAVAYCRWLSEKTGQEHRLPNESEWERAARGVDGREYPWGAKFDASLCNSEAIGLGSTTAVGLFPGGESPAGSDGAGILDASGNVLEWCSTKWRESYEEPADDALEGSFVRVLRGGGFAVGSYDARCAYRLRFGPVNFYFFVGFRLVAPSLIL